MSHVLQWPVAYHLIFFTFVGPDHLWSSLHVVYTYIFSAARFTYITKYNCNKNRETGYGEAV